MMDFDRPVRTVGDLRRYLEQYKDSAPLYCSVEGQAFELCVAEYNVGVVLELDLSKPVPIS